MTFLYMNYFIFCRYTTVKCCLSKWNYIIMSWLCPNSPQIVIYTTLCVKKYISPAENKQENHLFSFKRFSTSKSLYHYVFIINILVTCIYIQLPMCILTNSFRKQNITIHVRRKMIQANLILLIQRENQIK